MAASLESPREPWQKNEDRIEKLEEQMVSRPFAEQTDKFHQLAKKIGALEKDAKIRDEVVESMASQVTDYLERTIQAEQAVRQLQEQLDAHQQRI